LKEYVLIESMSVAVEIFQKSEEGVWFLASEAYAMSDVINISSIDITISLEDIYAEAEDLRSRGS
jgi:Uma2 family endonuclease